MEQTDFLWSVSGVLSSGKDRKLQTYGVLTIMLYGHPWSKSDPSPVGLLLHLTWRSLKRMCIDWSAPSLFCPLIGQLPPHSVLIGWLPPYSVDVPLVLPAGVWSSLWREVPSVYKRLVSRCFANQAPHLLWTPHSSEPSHPKRCKHKLFRVFVAHYFLPLF